MTESDTRPIVVRDWDGLSRNEAVKRLLALAEEEPRIYALQTWIVRMRALLAVWWAR